MVLTNFNEVMTEDIIQIHVEQPDGQIHTIEVPDGIQLSLMEVLKASEYDIMATCGGMALCATCHISVVDGMEKLGEQTDNELDMLDTLPYADEASRLSCQIQIDRALDGLKIKVF